MSAPVLGFWYATGLNLLEVPGERELNQAADAYEVQPENAEQLLHFEILDESYQPEQTAFVVRRGRVLLQRTTAPERWHTVATLAPGDVYGQVAVKAVREWRVELPEAAALFRIERGRLEGLLDRRDAIIEKKAFSGLKRRRIVSRYKDLVFKPSAAKIGDFLIHWGNSREFAGLPLELNDLMEMTAETPGGLYPVLAHLREADVIDVERGKVTLVDVDRIAMAVSRLLSGKPS